jgi:crossover junction endodeoxyribonuclease RuvC
MPTDPGNNVRILGVDTSLRSSGVGIIQGPVKSPTFVTCGTIKTPAAKPHTECLRRLDAGINELIEEHKPDSIAIEGIFYCKNVRTAITLGEVRGVVLTAAGRAGIPIFEYAPRDVKMALSGFGAASKDQVARMITTLLKLKQIPQEDAADALAIALCHLHRTSGVRAVEPKQL